MFKIVSVSVNLKQYFNFRSNKNLDATFSIIAVGGYYSSSEVLDQNSSEQFLSLFYFLKSASFNSQSLNLSQNNFVDKFQNKFYFTFQVPGDLVQSCLLRPLA